MLGIIWPCEGCRVMSMLMSDQPAAEASGAPAGPSVRVLFVDDHKMVADGLAALVGDEPGLEVVGVADRMASALAMTTELTPDVVVMDFRLPDSNGADGTRLLRALEHPPQVVVLTASEDDRVLRDALAAGCCGFLTKGGDVDTLVEAIRAAAIGESVFSPDVVRRLARVRHTVASGVDSLSARELEVLNALAAGHGTTEIARTLQLSEHTVRNHVRNVLAKLGAHTKLEAVVIAARAGLVDVGGHP